MGAKILNMSDYEGKRKSPQIEDGYTAIAHELLDEIYKLKMSGSEFQVLLFLIRNTYGFKKKFVKVSASSIARNTAIPIRAVRKTIKQLRQKKLIISAKNDTDSTRVYKDEDKRSLTHGINKDYSMWRYERSVPKTTPTISAKNDTHISAKNDTDVGFLPIRRNKEKEREKSARDLPKTISPKVIQFVDNFADHVLKKYPTTAPRKTQKYIYNSVDAITEILGDIGCDLDFVRKVLWWGLSDKFWSKTAKSLPGLVNDRNDTGTMNFQKMADDFESHKAKNDDTDICRLSNSQGRSLEECLAEIDKLME